MKPFLTFSFFAAFLLLFTYSQAQEVKTKTKAQKTKVKTEASAAMDASNTATASTKGNLSNASSLTNTTWTTYFGDPINDTLVIHYAVDSSSVQAKSTGMTVIYSVYKVNQDTITFNDLSGQYACPSDQVGNYRINMNGDMLKLDLINDDCEGRAGALKEMNWQRVKQTTTQ